MWNLLLGNNILWGKDLSLMWITVEKIRKTFHEKNFNLFSSSWHLEEKYTDNFGVALSHHHSLLSYFFRRIIRIIIIILSSLSLWLHPLVINTYIWRVVQVFWNYNIQFCTDVWLLYQFYVLYIVKWLLLLREKKLSSTIVFRIA